MRKLPKFVAIGLVAVVSTLMAAEFAEVGGWFPRAAVGADEVAWLFITCLQGLHRIVQHRCGGGIGEW